MSYQLLPLEKFCTNCTFYKKKFFGADYCKIPIMKKNYEKIKIVGYDISDPSVKNADNDCRDYTFAISDNGYC